MLFRSRAADILRRWDEFRPKFVKVFPRDFRRALSQLDEAERRVAEAKLMPAGCA